MNAAATPLRPIPPVHWLFLGAILLDGLAMSVVPFVHTGFALRLTLLGWSLFLFGVQVAWVLTLVGDAERDGSAGFLSRARAGFGMAVGCLLTPLWTGWLLGHLSRVRAALAKPESPDTARWRGFAAEGDKLLFAATLWLLVQLFLAERLAVGDEALDSPLQAFLAETPSVASELGLVNAGLLAAFGLVFALYTWRTAQRGVRALAEIPPAPRSGPDE